MRNRGPPSFALQAQDKAGSIWKIDFEGKSFLLVNTVKGAPRAGHYHKSDQTYYILAGSFDYEELIPGKPNSKSQLILREGDVHTIRSGYAHFLRAREDSLHIEYLEGEYEKTDYSPYKEIIDQYHQISSHG